MTYCYYRGKPTVVPLHAEINKLFNCKYFLQLEILIMKETLGNVC
jgi:hypothetical protein